MTFTTAKLVLRQAGVTLRKEDGEYRVNLRGGSEATAYYTDCIEDAYETGLTMAENVVFDDEPWAKEVR